MTTRESKARTLQPTRWDPKDWAYLAQVAKAIGTNRSDFIRTAALNAAKAISSLASPSYSVVGPQATTQNTRPNGNGPGLRQQAGDVSGGEGSRTRLAPEGINGQLSEKVGRQGGAGPTNGAKPKAQRAKASRS